MNKKQQRSVGSVIGSVSVLLTLVFLFLYIIAFSDVYALQPPKPTKPVTIMANSLARQSATGVTYYVATDGNNANAGTSVEAPFASIQHAVRLTQPGDTVYVREGFYHETVSIDNSGTLTAPITLAAYPGERPVIDGRYALPTGAIGRINDTVDPPKFFVWGAMLRIRGDHVRVSGLEIIRSLGRGLIVDGIAENRVTNVVIEKCSIHDIRNSPIHVFDGDYITIQECDIYHGSDYATHDRSAGELNWPHAVTALNSTYVTIRNNTVHENWGEGVGAGADSRHVTIENNVIFNNYALQVYIHRAHNVTVTHNLLYHTNDSTYWRGGDPSACVVLNNETNFPESITVKDVLIFSNIMVGCKRNVTLWGSERSGLPHENVIIRNNTLVNAHSNSREIAVGLHIAPGALINILAEKNIIYQLTQESGYAPQDPALTFTGNLWLRTPPANMLSPTDLIADPQLANPNAQLVPGGVKVRWYKPAPSSPAVLGNLGAYTFFQPRAPDLPTVVPTATPMPDSGGATPPPPTATPTPTLTPTPTIAPTIPATATRVTEGLQALYTFDEGGGVTVRDTSGVGAPLDLDILNAEAVTWQPGMLVVQNPATIASPAAATKIIDACKTSHEISLEAWVRPADTLQEGPARIVTLSADLDNRNFMLGQGLWGGQPADLYTVRLRTTERSLNGEPAVTTAAGDLEARLTHVVYTRAASGASQVYIDATASVSQTIPGDFANWDVAYRLVLANELQEARPWLGEYHLVAIYCRALSAAEVLQNYIAGGGFTAGNVLFLPLIDR